MFGRILRGRINKNKMSIVIRHLVSTIVGFFGCVGVLWVIIIMNEKPPSDKKERTPAQISMNVKVPPKVKKKPKRKRKPKKKAKSQRRLTPPTPSIGSNLAGIDINLPLAGDLSLEAGNLLDDVGNTKDIIMSGDAVDKRPRPRPTNMAPRYPKRAAKDRISGKVILKVLISADGSVLKTKVVKAEPRGIFEEAAVNAVSNWKFDPAIYNGQAVKMWVKQPVVFKI